VTFKIVGLDWFDFVVHGVVTIAGGVVLNSLFGGTGGDAAIGLWLAASAVALGYRRKRALAVEERAPADSARLNALEDRVAELEAQQGRVYELEERLDFTERMLTQQRERESARLPARSGDG
jgi:hypothetical protein